MKVILQENVEKVGSAGELVNVKPGFARNYLFPNKLAVTATTKNLTVLDHQKKVIDSRMKKREKQAQELKNKLENFSCTISKKVGEEEKLFGTVTAMDVEEVLRNEGFDIDKKDIVIEEPIKKLGIYNVPVKLSKDVTATIKVWVVEKDK
ncbi:MAG: 50S ribosomal protein L9 [Deltaproteobacteria bacterium]|nr:50S ribosomal protein L9 [Deltaproteobacteria bacterium]